MNIQNTVVLLTLAFASYSSNASFLHTCSNLARFVVGAPPLVITSKSLTDQQLLHAALTIAIERDLEIVSANAIVELCKVGNIAHPQKLLDSRTLNPLIRELKSRANLNQQDYEGGLGRHISQLVSLLSTNNRGRDDFHNGYGYRLLPDTDKAFHDPSFLVNTLRNVGTTASGFADNDPSSASLNFHRVIKDHLDEYRVIAFAQSGSDANNLLYDIADRVATNRFGSKSLRGELLVFDGAYGGGRGRIRNFCKINSDRYCDVSPFVIRSPVSDSFDDISPDELERIVKIELEVLDEIRTKAEDQSLAIGGILIEPIQGSAGGKFYRKGFLKDLQNLADELEIPVIADEILMGGGRTGKFFSYEHYPDFKPDFITFGKGLATAGIMSVTKSNRKKRPDFDFLTRVKSTDDLLRSAQIIKRVFEDDLINNAKEVGKYFLNRLNKYEKKKGVPEWAMSRGIGLFIVINTVTAAQLGINYATGGRVMPFLTLTKEDVDKFFEGK